MCNSTSLRSGLSKSKADCTITCNRSDIFEGLATSLPMYRYATKRQIHLYRYVQVSGCGDKGVPVDVVGEPGRGSVCGIEWPTTTSYSSPRFVAMTKPYSLPPRLISRPLVLAVDIHRSQAWSV